MADLQTDLSALADALTSNEAAITAVQSYVTAQNQTIGNLQGEVDSLKAGGSTAGLEALIARMKTDTANLAAVVPAAQAPTPQPTPAPAPVTTSTPNAPVNSTTTPADHNPTETPAS